MLTRVLLLARAEVQRFVGSRRGLVSLLAFCLLWFVAMKWFVLPASRLAATATGFGGEDILDEYFGAGNLLRWPAPEYSAWWVAALYILPFVAVVASADQIASDRARGTLRYLVLRASRLEILAGRFLGQACIMAVAALATILSTVFMVWRVHDTLTPNTDVDNALLLSTLPMATLALWMTLLPWLALMALVSALAKTPSQATRYALIIWVLLSIAASMLSRQFGDHPVIDYLLPGSPIRGLLAHVGADTVLPASIGLVHTAVFLLGAGIVMRRRDL